MAAAMHAPCVCVDVSAEQVAAEQGNDQQWGTKGKAAAPTTGAETSLKAWQWKGHTLFVTTMQAGGKRLQDRIIGQIKVLSRSPGWLVFGFLMLACLIGFGTWGVVAAANGEKRTRIAAAVNTARRSASSMGSLIEAVFNPCVTMAMLVRQQPHWNLLNATFYDSTAEELFRVTTSKANPIVNLALVPNAIIRSIIPVTGFEKAVGLDLLRAPDRRPDALKAIESHALTMAGPSMLVVGMQGLVGRFPVFIPNADENDTFGSPGELFECGSACYHPIERDKFWGFTMAVVDWELAKKQAQLYELCSSFTFMMTFTDVFGTPLVPIAQCAIQQQAPINVTISVLNNQWTLWVVDSRGWTPDWRDPLIAAVVVISLLFTILVLLIVSSHMEQKMFLEGQIALNKQLSVATRKLEEEKARTETLLARQMDLISCFEGEARTERLSSEASNRVSTEQTLDAIDAIRRSITSRKYTDVQLDEMLGEGSFGKVYKGRWNGTEVAVKTIILPALMSGAEKKEKMAIMEAAISSSLCHPHIVQTYTYSIRSMCDSSSRARLSNTMSTMRVGQLESLLSDSQCSEDKPSFEEGDRAIHSYEVQLVLEFCDKGCLRDALDQGAFLGEYGLNYRAILDTAIDIAKACLHLHCANVLHSDLKANNVMLKSSGSDGRGLVAKVSDFGLSIRLDTAQTHLSSVFQGTLTHMAPEVLMQGHVSKAADVYAFGITLWELFTGGKVFDDVPRAHLGHAITQGRRRPAFSAVTPSAYRDLACSCWAAAPEDRPDFQAVLDCLLNMRTAVGGTTPALVIIRPTEEHAAAAAAATAAAAAAAAAWERPEGSSMSEDGRPSHHLQPDQQRHHHRRHSLPERSYPQVPKVLAGLPPVKHRSGQAMRAMLGAIVVGCEDSDTPMSIKTDGPLQSVPELLSEPFSRWVELGVLQQRVRCLGGSGAAAGAPALI